MVSELMDLSKLIELDYPKDAIPDEKYKVFLQSLDNDIGSINQKIENYNQAKTKESKIETLNQIYSFLQQMNNTYPLNFIAWHTDYQEIILKYFWHEIKHRYQQLGVISLHHRVLPAGRSALTKPSLAVDVFANMNAYELEVFMRCAWNEPDKLFEKMSKQYLGDNSPDVQLYSYDNSPDSDAENDDYSQANNRDKENFRMFLTTHKISVISGEGNSRNFKIEKVVPDGSVPLVLKIDARLGRSKQAEHELRKKGFLHLTQLLGEERPALVSSLDLEKEPKCAAILTLTDFCPGGDLKSKADSWFNAPVQVPLVSVVKSAVHYYQQMADILLDLQKKGFFFPDAKNTNWLIDENDRLKIADTKSLLFLRSENSMAVCLRDAKNQWPGRVVMSQHLISPDMIDFASKGKTISADKAHSYMLGKNLYQYMTNCGIDFLYDYKFQDELSPGEQFTPKNSFDEDNDFTSNIFMAPGGQVLESIIKGMVRADPIDRLPLAEVSRQLAHLRAWLDNPRIQSLYNECISMTGKFLTICDQSDDTVTDYINQKIETLGDPLNESDLQILKNELSALSEHVADHADKHPGQPNRLDAMLLQAFVASYSEKKMEVDDTTEATANMRERIQKMKTAETTDHEVSGKPTL